jgi:hypothetical protein
VAIGKRTDWDEYYQRPAAPASVTRRITTRLLISLMRRFAGDKPGVICELGGANSCFYESMRAAFNDADYLVIDNNAFGLQLLERRRRGDRQLSARNEDVLTMSTANTNADIVFSVGLIEHFQPTDTAAVIEKHFALARRGGLVIITFPTPTWLYNATRGIAERLDVWRFPDERPLTFDEVEAQVTRHGEILHSQVNWPIVLTQGVIVAQA